MLAGYSLGGVARAMSVRLKNLDTRAYLTRTL
jgi:hypothetical protein